jgi:hypothetical protein
MRIYGEWLLCDDSVLRPVIRGEILESDGTWHPVADFLVDTGADRTVFSAIVLASLRLQPVVTGVGVCGVCVRLWLFVFSISVCDKYKITNA